MTKMNFNNFMMDSKKVALIAAVISVLIISLIIRVNIIALISVVIISLGLIIGNLVKPLRTNEMLDIEY